MRNDILEPKSVVNRVPPEEFFQVQEQVRDDQKEEAAEPDSNYSKFGNLTNRLRELVQQPSPVGSGPVDIGQLLRQLMPIEDEASEIGQPMIVCRETQSDPGRGVSHPDQC